MFQTQTLTTPILTPNLKLFDDMATDYSSLIASSSISASDSLRSQANFSMPAIDSSQLNAYSGEALPNAMDVAMTNSSGALNMSASHLFHLNSLQSDASSARSSSQSPQIQSDHIQLLQQQQHHQQLQQQSPLFSSKSFAMGGMFGRQQKALHNHFGQMNGLYGNELTGFNYQNDPTDLVIAESDEQSEQMEDSNASSSDMSELKYAAKNFTSSSVAGVGMAVLHGTLPSSAQYQHQQMQQAYGNKFSAQSMAAVATNLNLFSTLPANLMPMQFNKPNLDLESSLSSSFASNFDSKPVGKRTSGRRPNNSTEEKVSIFVSSVRLIVYLSFSTNNIFN